MLLKERNPFENPQCANGKEVVNHNILLLGEKSSHISIHELRGIVENCLFLFQ